MSTADKTRRSYSYKATDKLPAQKKTKGEGWGGKRPGAGRPRKNPVGTKPHSLYFRVRVRKDLHRKWREMKDAGGFATDTDFVKHLLGVVDEEPTPVAQPSAKPPANAKPGPSVNSPPTTATATAGRTPMRQGQRKGRVREEEEEEEEEEEDDEEETPPSSPSPPPRRRGRKRASGPLGSQKPAKKLKTKVEPPGRGALGGSRGTEGMKSGGPDAGTQGGPEPSTSSDAAEVQPPPSMLRARQPRKQQKPTKPKVGVVGKGMRTSKGQSNDKTASDHSELDQDLADIRNGTLHTELQAAAAEKPAVAEVVAMEDKGQDAGNSSLDKAQAAKNLSSDGMKIIDNESQKPVLDHGDRDPDLAGTENGTTCAGVTTGEELSAVETVAQATAVRSSEENAVYIATPSDVPSEVAMDAAPSNVPSDVAMDTAPSDATMEPPSDATVDTSKPNQ